MRIQNRPRDSEFTGTVLVVGMVPADAENELNVRVGFRAAVIVVDVLLDGGALYVPVLVRQQVVQVHRFRGWIYVNLLTRKRPRAKSENKGSV